MYSNEPRAACPRVTSQPRSSRSVAQHGSKIGSRRFRLLYGPVDRPVGLFRGAVTGKPGRIHGLVDACVDCGAIGDLILLPGRLVMGEIYHDDTCPAAAGITEWKPVP